MTKADAGNSGFAYVYQWIRVDSDGTSNATNISGATSSTYTLVSADQGKKIKVKVGFKDDAGNFEERTSDAYPAAGTVAAADTTRPTVTAASTGYYSNAAATTALAGPQKAGADIYTKVTFSEDMKHVKNDGARARPELFIRISPTERQYDIVDNGDSLASGDCKPNHATDTNVYVCRYTVDTRDNGVFGVKAGTNSQDKAGNALATAYTHAATLTLDTADPGITFPSSWTPTTLVAATIALSDAGAIKKYGAIVVDGSTGTAANCDTASEVGTGNLTSLDTPLVLVNYMFTPPSDSAGKKVCVYAEDAAGNSHAALWGTAIAGLQAPVAPTGLTATKDGRFAINLSWTAPAADAARAAVTGYTVERSANGTDGWTALTRRPRREPQATRTAGWTPARRATTGCVRPAPRATARGRRASRRRRTRTRLRRSTRTRRRAAWPKTRRRGRMWARSFRRRRTATATR